jgi:hypothetical protein
MRTFSSIVVSLFFSSSALAESAINLSPMRGFSAIDVVATKNVTGSCGTSIVRVLGVMDVRNSVYTSDADAEIIVRGGPSLPPKDLILSLKSGVLSDLNGVACVATKSGSRLLVWSKCGGSMCVRDDFSFIVIDPDRLVLLAPKDPIKGQCDAQCASQLLGNKLPQKINGQ